MATKGVWKVVFLKDETVISETGFIPDQPADVNCPFIHACDFSSVADIITRFYKDSEVTSFQLDLEQIIREGFTVKYEPNRPGGVFYWHIYRPADQPKKLMSRKCIL